MAKCVAANAWVRFIHAAPSHGRLSTTVGILPGAKRLMYLAVSPYMRVYSGEDSYISVFTKGSTLLASTHVDLRPDACYTVSLMDSVDDTVQVRVLVQDDSLFPERAPHYAKFRALNLSSNVGPVNFYVGWWPQPLWENVLEDHQSRTYMSLETKNGPQKIRVFKSDQAAEVYLQLSEAYEREWGHLPMKQMPIGGELTAPTPLPKPSRSRSKKSVEVQPVIGATTFDGFTQGSVYSLILVGDANAKDERHLPRLLLVADNLSKTGYQGDPDVAQKMKEDDGNESDDEDGDDEEANARAEARRKKLEQLYEDIPSRGNLGRGRYFNPAQRYHALADVAIGDVLPIEVALGWTHASDPRPKAWYTQTMKKGQEKHIGSIVILQTVSGSADVEILEKKFDPAYQRRAETTEVTKISGLPPNVASSPCILTPGKYAVRIEEHMHDVDVEQGEFYLVVFHRNDNGQIVGTVNKMPLRSVSSDGSVRTTFVNTAKNSDDVLIDMECASFKLERDTFASGKPSESMLYGDIPVGTYRVSLKDSRGYSLGLPTYVMPVTSDVSQLLVITDGASKGSVRMLSVPINSAGYRSGL